MALNTDGSNSQDFFHIVPSDAQAKLHVFFVAYKHVNIRSNGTVHLLTLFEPFHEFQSFDR